MYQIEQAELTLGNNPLDWELMTKDSFKTEKDAYQRIALEMLEDQGWNYLGNLFIG